MKRYLVAALLIMSYTQVAADSCRLNGVVADCVITTVGSPPPSGLVNGVCGSVNGQSLATAPTSGLCSSGTQSSLTGGGPWNWTCAGGNGGTSVGCSAQLVVQTGCADTFSGADVDWKPMASTKIFPQQAVSASGGFGRAVRFVADAVAYPGGITITLVDQSSNTPPKDAVISVCPHSFTPVANQSACSKTGIATNQGFLLRFGPAQRFYDCSLTPGVVYYLNFKASDNHDASSQFVLYGRLN